MRYGATILCALWAVIPLGLGTPGLGQVKRSPYPRANEAQAQETESADLSLRIKGMGSDLAGIVSDEYTDILRNPAYLASAKKAEGVAEYSGSGAPASGDGAVAVISPGLRLGVLASGHLTRTARPTYQYERLDVNVDNGRLERWRDTYLTDTLGTAEGFQATVLSALCLHEAVSLGVLYRYSRGRTERLTSRSSISRMIEVATQETLTVSQSVDGRSSSLQRASQSARLGLLLGSESPWQIDVTLGFLRAKEDSGDQTWTSRLYDYYGDAGGHKEEALSDSKSLPGTDWKGVPVALRISRSWSEDWAGRAVLAVEFADAEIGGVSRESMRSWEYWPQDSTSSTWQYEASVGGDAATRRLWAAVGAEGRFWEEWVVGTAVKAGYERRTVDAQETGAALSVSDTSSDTYGIDRGMTREFRRTYLRIPLGVEKVFDFGLSLRFGMTARVEKTSSKGLDWERVSGSDVFRENIPAMISEELTTDFTIGLGYDFTDRLKLDVFAIRDVSDLSGWESRATYQF